jgi:DNA-binding response OmpR family regulator
MNGFKLVQNIRELETEGRTPILMTSAIYKKANYKHVALEAGADQYMFKPTKTEEREEFQRRIDELLNVNSVPDHSSEVRST